MYRQPIHQRNGIHEAYRTDISPPLNNHENFLNRRVSEYEDEDHSVSQRENNILRNVIDARPPELSETRVIEDNKRILKPAAARLFPVDLPDFTDQGKRYFVTMLPQNTSEKKYILIKKEPSEPVQVNVSVNFVLMSIFVQLIYNESKMRYYDFKYC